MYLYDIFTLSKYSAPVRFVINNASSSSISVGDAVDISRECRISGDVQIGDNALIESGSTIHGQIELADNTRIGEESRIRGNISVSEYTDLVRANDLIGDINIGKYCAIAPQVHIEERNHPTSHSSIKMRLHSEILDNPLDHTSKGTIEIGHDVWIGAKAIVLSGVTIGHGAVIGAGSVVTDDVEPYSVVAGVPADHKKWRFPPHIREQLLDLEWWEWSETRIRENESLFTSRIDDRESIYDLVSDSE